jgi:Periplasmic serine proteases (ClpP class)
MELIKRVSSLNKVVFKLRVSGMITPATTAKVKAELNRFRIYSPVALAVVINSAGGSASQSNLIRQELLAFAEKKNIKVYCFVEDFATSGAYLVVSAGNEVYSLKSSLVGAVGASFTFFDVKSLAKDYGITRRQ